MYPFDIFYGVYLYHIHQHHALLVVLRLHPDLAGLGALAAVKAPTLLIVGSLDGVVIDLNQAAANAMQCAHELAIVAGAGHLFEEPGKLDEVVRLATAWFLRHLEDFEFLLCQHRCGPVIPGCLSLLRLFINPSIYIVFESRINSITFYGYTFMCRRLILYTWLPMSSLGVDEALRLISAV